MNRPATKPKINKHKLMCLAVCICLTASACGSSDDTSVAVDSSTTSGATSASEDSQATDSDDNAVAGSEVENGAELTPGECGTVPVSAATDPTGLLAEFPDDIASGYDLYPYEIRESALVDFVSSKDGDFTAAMVSMPSVTPFISTMTDSIRSNLEAAGVEVVADLAPDDPSNVPLQLQQFNEALALGPDVIFYQPIAPEPSIELAKAAYDAGVVLVAVQIPIDSQYAVSVTRNVPLDAAAVAAGVVGAIDGEGSVLRVQGVPGIPNTTWSDEGIDAVLGLCPDVEVAGEVVGFFQAAAAQAEVLKFLATHPEGVDAVMQSGTMGRGIANAFEEFGLPIPPIGDDGASQGLAAQALLDPDYPYFGTLTFADKVGESAVEIGLRILSGEGPKINQIAQPSVILSQDNLSEYVDSSWDVTDGSDFVGPDEDFLPTSRLDLYFTNPGS